MRAMALPGACGTLDADEKHDSAFKKSSVLQLWAQLQSTEGNA